jgi:hypothetical protein
MEGVYVGTLAVFQGGKEWDVKKWKKFGER